MQVSGTQHGGYINQSVLGTGHRQLLAGKKTFFIYCGGEHDRNWQGLSVQEQGTSYRIIKPKEIYNNII